MKKVISVREIIIILISILVVTISTSVYATGGLSLNNTNNGTISPSDYNEWKDIQADNNTATGNNNSNTNNNINNSTNNTTNNSNTKVYNTNKNTDLPQT